MVPLNDDGRQTNGLCYSRILLCCSSRLTHVTGSEICKQDEFSLTALFNTAASPVVCAEEDPTSLRFTACVKLKQTLALSLLLVSWS